MGFWLGTNSCCYQFGEPRGIAEITTPSTSWQAADRSSALILQHHHEQHRARPQRRGHPRRGPAQHGHTQDRACRRSGRSCPGAIRAKADANKVEQDRRIIVETVKSHPRDADDPRPPPTRSAGSTCRNRRARRGPPRRTRWRRAASISPARLTEPGPRVRQSTAGRRARIHPAQRPTDPPAPGSRSDTAVSSPVRCTGTSARRGHAKSWCTTRVTTSPRPGEHARALRRRCGTAARAGFVGGAPIRRRGRGSRDARRATGPAGRGVTGIGPATGTRPTTG